MLLARVLAAGLLLCAVPAAAAAEPAEDPSACLWRNLPAGSQAKFTAGPPKGGSWWSDAEIRWDFAGAMVACLFTDVEAGTQVIPTYVFELKQKAAFRRAGGDPAVLERAWAGLPPETRAVLAEGRDDPARSDAFDAALKPVLLGLPLKNGAQFSAAIGFFIARADRVDGDLILAGKKPRAAAATPN